MFGLLIGMSRLLLITYFQRRNPSMIRPVTKASLGKQTDQKQKVLKYELSKNLFTTYTKLYRRRCNIRCGRSNTCRILSNIRCRNKQRLPCCFSNDYPCSEKALTEKTGTSKGTSFLVNLISPNTFSFPKVEAKQTSCSKNRSIESIFRLVHISLPKLEVYLIL